jgi:hypothetical protein
MATIVLAVFAAAFLTFGAVLSSVSIWVALGDRADFRRRHRELARLEAEAEARFEHRSPAGQAHAAIV